MPPPFSGRIVDRNGHQMTFKTIITHPGSAHKDDFLACCLAIAKSNGNAPIFRRDPMESDLEDTQCCLLDIGLKHEPAKLNFDHHQFDKDAAPTCSLSLFLDHLNLYQDALSFCEWLQPAEWFDSRGAIATAKWLGVERKVLGQLNSPIDVTLLRRFAQATELQPQSPLYEIMRMIGDDLLDYLSGLKKRIAYIERHSEVWTVERADKSAFRALFMPRTNPLPEEPSAGLDRYARRLSEKGNVIGMVYPDRRGPGYGLSRFEDNPPLDFTQIQAEPDVHFAHARGFVAKTSATDPKRLKALFAKALVS